jgi:hypothetical protein
MKLIQISPRQLICEDDTYRQQIFLFSLQITFVILWIFLPIVSAALPDVGVFWLAVILVGGLIMFVGCLWVGFPKYTAIIDLDRECIEIKKYWPLLRKHRIRQYPIALIKTIEVRKVKEDGHKLVWKQHRGSVVKFGDNYTDDRSRAEADAEQIRSFLNQDGRDIEISFFYPAWSWSCFLSSE